MAEKIKFTSVDTNFEGDKHLELSDKKDIDKLFDKLEESEHSKENQLHDFIKSSLDGVSNTVKLEEAIKETFGEKEKILETNNGIVVNGGLHIHIESKGDREYFLNGLIKEKNEYFKRVLVADDIKEKTDEAITQELEKQNKDLDEEKKITELTTEELSKLEEKVHKEFDVDLEADREVVAGSGDETKDVPSEGLWELLMSGRTEEFFTKVGSITSGVLATVGVFTGLSGNKKLEKALAATKVKVYSMISDNSSLDYTDQIAAAEKTILDIETLEKTEGTNEKEKVEEENETAAD